MSIKKQYILYVGCIFVLIAWLGNFTNPDEKSFEKYMAQYAKAPAGYVRHNYIICSTFELTHISQTGSYLFLLGKVYHISGDELLISDNSTHQF